MPTGQGHRPLYTVLGEIAALWAIANFGYFILFPSFGFDLSYNLYLKI